MTLSPACTSLRRQVRTGARPQLLRRWGGDVRLCRVPGPVCSSLLCVLDALASFSRAKPKACFPVPFCRPRAPGPTSPVSFSGLRPRPSAPSVLSLLVDGARLTLRLARFPPRSPSSPAASPCHYRHLKFPPTRRCIFIRVSGPGSLSRCLLTYLPRIVTVLQIVALARRVPSPSGRRQNNPRVPPPTRRSVLRAGSEDGRSVCYPLAW